MPEQVAVGLLVTGAAELLTCAGGVAVRGGVVVAAGDVSRFTADVAPSSPDSKPTDPDRRLSARRDAMQPGLIDKYVIVTPIRRTGRVDNPRSTMQSPLSHRRS